MTKKNEAAMLVRGMGMAMSFLQALTDEIVAAGGFEEMIHFLSKEQARPLVRKIAKVVVESDWKIPCSLIERLVREYWIGQSSDNVAWDAKWVWKDVLTQLGIPASSYWDEQFAVGSRVHDAVPIPPEVVEQLRSTTIRYPMVVTWAEEEYLVTDVYSEEGDTGTNWKEGSTFRETIARLVLVPAKYFDLKR